MVPGFGIDTINVAYYTVADGDGQTTSRVLGPGFHLHSSPPRPRERTHPGSLRIKQSQRAVAVADSASATLLRDGIEIGQRKLGANHPLTSVMMLTMAEAMALNGRHDEALMWLKNAIDHGYRDAKQIQGDEDLRSIRRDPRYGQLLEALGDSSAK